MENLSNEDMKKLANALNTTGCTINRASKWEIGDGCVKLGGLSVGGAKIIMDSLAEICVSSSGEKLPKPLSDWETGLVSIAKADADKKISCEIHGTGKKGHGVIGLDWVVTEAIETGILHDKIQKEVAKCRKLQDLVNCGNEGR